MSGNGELLSRSERRKIGEYRVLEMLGQGGMGTVYLCDQRGTLARRVAVKVLRQGLSAAAFESRFDAERRALARMDHPGIASVFDTGVDEGGRPYLVMEYVPGPPVTDYCRAHDLDTRERLTLFLDVCAAVQHAHERGVLHRDLKPANVLVVEVDGARVPKIIDFGLAKAIEGELSPGADPTLAGVAVGTLHYGSPEQIRGDADIDTRADVWGLGVLLYELLTDRTPFDPEDLATMTRAQQERAICNVRPIRPSSRVAEPARSRRLRGDLDWIVQTALSKLPQDRYASVAELAAEIERHFAGLPVGGRRRGIAYRSWKFARRFRLQVVTAAAALVFLVGGIVGTSLGLAAGEQAAARASEALLQFDLLGRRVEIAAAVAALPRPSPEPLPPLRRWLVEYGEPLERELAVTRTALQRLRDRARTYRDEDRERDLARQPLHSRSRLLASILADYRAQLEWLGATERERDIELLQPRVRELERESRRIEAARRRRATWRFDEAAYQYLHRVLTEREAALEEFTGTHLAAVRADVEWWTRARARTVDAYAGRWRAAAARVASNARYSGLELHPQVGLVPLGPDRASGLEEFLDLRSGRAGLDLPERDAAGRLAFPEGLGVVFVLLPGGEHRCPDTSVTVRLDAFFISKFEITCAQWRRVGRIGSYSGVLSFRPGMLMGPFRLTTRHPQPGLSASGGRRAFQRYGWDLPTEAQWLYAARAGRSEVAPDRVDPQWPRADSWPIEHWRPWTGSRRTPAPADALTANPFGVVAILGNLNEVCRDRVGDGRGPPRPGDGLRPGKGRIVVHREGVAPGELTRRPEVNSVSKSTLRPVRALFRL